VAAVILAQHGHTIGTDSEVNRKKNQWNVSCRWSFFSVEEIGLSNRKSPRFVTGHDFSRATAVPDADSALAAAELQIAENTSPQGQKPSYFFCGSCGTTKVVPCYKTTHLLPKRDSENGRDL
jgi:hypothetical protein